MNKDTNNLVSQIVIDAIASTEGSTLDDRKNLVYSELKNKLDRTNLYDYVIHCDETNNPNPDELHIELYYKENSDSDFIMRSIVSNSNGINFHDKIVNDMDV